MRNPITEKSPRVRPSTEATESELRSDADEHESGAQLMLVRLLHWGTRNNRPGIDRIARDT